MVDFKWIINCMRYEFIIRWIQTETDENSEFIECAGETGARLIIFLVLVVQFSIFLKVFGALKSTRSAIPLNTALVIM